MDVAERLYIHRTPAVERALKMVAALDVGVDERASQPKKLEAWMEYTVAHVEEEQGYAERVAAYEELAAVPGRRDRVRRRTREAAARGLL